MSADGTGIRDYAAAIDCLNNLQTNASILDALKKAGPRMNDRSLPEMNDYVRRIGYKTSDFDKLNIIHVTGTKGKGSTSAISESILRHFVFDSLPSVNVKAPKRLRTGLYTSPHLMAVRERIRIDGTPISEEKFAKYFFEVWDRLEATNANEVEGGQNSMKQELRAQRAHADKPTYFRYLTLLAFHVFTEEQVDVAVMEVGVGGEYDSTNIIEKPIVCGITSLGLDHVSVLGDTIDKIAWHKAGIFKPNVPGVSFEQPPAAMAVVEQRAKDKNVPLQVVHASEAKQLDSISLGLAGKHQQYNATVAIALCRIWLQRMYNIQLPLPSSPEQYVPAGFLAGLKEVKWPGRGQVLDVSKTNYAADVPSGQLQWYLDGAHTMESLEVCSDWFSGAVGEKDANTERVLVFNCTNGRDGPKLLKILADLHKKVEFDHAVFCSNVTFKEIRYAGDNVNNTTAIDDKLELQQSFAKAWMEYTHPSTLQGVASSAASVVSNLTSTVPAHPTQSHAHVVPTVEHATLWVREFAQKLQSSKRVQVLTTGSLILVGNTMTVLGYQYD